LSDLKLKDEQLKKESVVKKGSSKGKSESKNLPEESFNVPQVVQVKSNVSQSTEPKQSSSNPHSNSQRIKSGDYRSWDRFNVDAELERLDKETVPAPPAVISPSTHLPSTDIDVRPEMSLNEKKVLAENEKIKGNDAFRVGEYEEAVSQS
jgi:hypothetical protein